MLGKKVLVFGVILMIMAVLPGSCKKGDPTSGIMPKLPTNKDPGEGYGVYIGFRHTQPGVSSEVSVTVYGQPGDEVKLTLNGPAVTPPAAQAHRVEEDGSVTFTWKITRFGTYDAHGTYAEHAINAQNINTSVVVK